MAVKRHNFASSDTVNIREHLADVISILVNVDHKAVEDKLLLTMETTELANLVEIAELSAKYNFDPTVYCCKTGQQIDYWSDDRIGQLIQTVGKIRAIEIMKIQSHNRVADHWLFTDGKALDQLSDNDPVGYFVYSLTKVLIEFQPFVEHLNTRNSQIAKDKITELKIIVYKQANKIPLIVLIRVNELMRRYLSIIQSRAAYKHLAFPETRMEYITDSVSSLEDFEQGMQKTLGNLIRYEYSRGKLKPNLTYQEVMDLKLSYKGWSNFRNQKKMASMTEIEHTMYLLKDFMQDLTPTMVQIKTPEVNQQPQNAFIHKGELKLKLSVKKEKPIKLSFANVLQRKVK